MGCDGRQKKKKGQGMDEIAELERRITAALERITRGVEKLGQVPVAPVQVKPVDADELARLREELDEERMANAQLNERLKVLRTREAAAKAALQDEIERLTRQVDDQGSEMRRLNNSASQLREELRLLSDAARQGMADPQMINKAMLAELEALRAARAAETGEMADILSALGPILDAEEARIDG